jgi:hypothetical protein
MWSDGPEVALNWLFPYPILPPLRSTTLSAVFAGDEGLEGSAS